MINKQIIQIYTALYPITSHPKSNHTQLCPNIDSQRMKTRLVEHRKDLVQSKALQRSQVKPANASREMRRNSAISAKKMLRDAKFAAGSFFVANKFLAVLAHEVWQWNSKITKLR